MRRLSTASAFFALALVTTSAIGQPPPDSKAKGDEKRPLGEKVKPADPTDAALAAALADDPDVRMARAKVQLAEAELAKARLAVTQKVFAVRGAVQDAKAALIMAQVELDNTQRMLRAEKVPNETAHPSYRLALAKLEAAQAKLATVEIELKILTNPARGAPVSDLVDPNAAAVAAGLRYLSAHQSEIEADRLAQLARLMAVAREREAVRGPIPERIRAALDKPVKLGANGAEITFAQAVEVFKKDGGLDVPIRGTSTLPPIKSQGEELPIGAWLQLFQDEKNGHFYVREYGLLFAKDFPPSDAQTLTEFWKQKPPKQKEEPKK